MLIKIEIPTKIEVKQLSDLGKYKAFMEDNNLKINKSQIARELGVNRKTVNKYLDGFEKTKTRSKGSKCDEYYDTIKELLTSPTQKFYYIRVLYQYLTDNYGMQIPKPTFYHYIQNHEELSTYFNESSHASSTKAILRYETAPGEQAQFDWKEKIDFVLRDTGEVVVVHVLTLLLGYSRFRVYKLTLNMVRETLIHNLLESLEVIGGVPKILLTDNMKTVMDEPRTQHKDGTVNREFEAFAKDMGFQIKACVAASPQTKGKVESQMKLLDEIRAYSGKLNLLELYQLVERINERINNSICTGTGKIPIEAFQKEKDSLLKLPTQTVRNQYRIKTQTVTVNRASLISVKSKFYSVPKEYIGKEVTYQLIESKIYVYCNTKLIALHQISENKINYAPQDYVEILTSRFKGKDESEIETFAKQNLKIMGGIFNNE